MSLGEHLRAHQYSCLAAVHPIENGLHRPACRSRVAIQPRERRVREQPRERFLDPLGSLTDGIQRLSAAAANRGHRAVRAAMVTAQLLRAPVQGHSRIAVLAGRDPAAGVAEQARCIAAAIQEHDDLAVRLQMLRRLPASPAWTSLDRTACLRRSIRDIRGACAAPGRCGKICFA